MREDSTFLCRNGLTNYSLLVAKVDCRSLKEDGLTFKCYRSAKEEGVGYAFGIVDYL